MSSAKTQTQLNKLNSLVMPRLKTNPTTTRTAKTLTAYSTDSFMRGFPPEFRPAGSAPQSGFLFFNFRIKAAPASATNAMPGIA